MTARGAAAQLSWWRWLGCLEVGEDRAGSVWAEKARNLGREEWA
jgi:hypothetical protein